MWGWCNVMTHINSRKLESRLHSTYYSTTKHRGQMGGEMHWEGGGMKTYAYKVIKWIIRRIKKWVVDKRLHRWKQYQQDCTWYVRVEKNTRHLSPSPGEKKKKLSHIPSIRSSLVFNKPSLKCKFAMWTCKPHSHLIVNYFDVLEYDQHLTDIGNLGMNKQLRVGKGDFDGMELEVVVVLILLLWKKAYWCLKFCPGEWS